MSIEFILTFMGSHASHHSNFLEEMFRYMLHGMAWRIGGRIINAMPFFLIIIIVIIGLIVWWFTKHKK